MKHLALTARLAVVMIAAGSGFGQSAIAAPFCIRNQILSPQCMYYDANQCQQEAQRQNGECVPNPAELRLAQGNGEYCLVTSGQASICAYHDQQTCVRDAARQQGACVPANPSLPQRTPDPYSPLNGQ